MFYRRVRLFCARRLERAINIRLNLKKLEDRAVPAVVFFSDPANPGKSIVQFSEDVPGASDTLLLRPTNGGLLQYQLNGAAFTTDLNSTLAGVQSLSLTAISRVDVLLGAGDDVLDIDAGLQCEFVADGVGVVFTADGGRTVCSSSCKMRTCPDDNQPDDFDGRRGQFHQFGAGQTHGWKLEQHDQCVANSGDCVYRKTTLDGGGGGGTVTGGSGDDAAIGTQGQDFWTVAAAMTRNSAATAARRCLGGDSNDTLFGGNGQDVHGWRRRQRLGFRRQRAGYGPGRRRQRLAERRQRQRSWSTAARQRPRRRFGQRRVGP